MSTASIINLGNNNKSGISYVKTSLSDEDYYEIIGGIMIKLGMPDYNDLGNMNILRSILYKLYMTVKDHVKELSHGFSVNNKLQPGYQSNFPIQNTESIQSSTQSQITPLSQQACPYNIQIIPTQPPTSTISGTK